jgi:hypothetical protein
MTLFKQTKMDVLPKREVWDPCSHVVISRQAVTILYIETFHGFIDLDPRAGYRYYDTLKLVYVCDTGYSILTLSEASVTH